MDSALNNLQRLTCHKTETTKEPKLLGATWEKKPTLLLHGEQIEPIKTTNIEHLWRN